MAVGAIAILSILAIGTTSSVLQELRLAKFVRDASIPVFEAGSVIEALKAILSADGTPYSVTLYELRPRAIVLGGDVAETSFIDEQSKANINTSSSETLSRIPGLSGNPELIDAVVGATFYFKEELLLLKGVTRDIYDEISPFVTAYGTGALNINTAPAQTMAALGMEDDLVSKVVEYRAGHDGLDATEDDMEFSFPAEIVPLLEQQGLTAYQRALLEELVSLGKLGTNSDYITFKISIKKNQAGGSVPLKANRSFNITVNKPTGMVVQWQEV
ncbi:MAG TPA: hypothetical protein DCL35_00980 [Candidatus Omnitrophica bacterium]|nr:hypothetical protein [Candidatus Omnitrophota bacterium]